VRDTSHLSRYGGGSDRLRLFCALRPARATVERLVEWQPAALHGGRIVQAENLHFTLAFLGARPEADVPAVVGALQDAVRGAGEMRFRARAYRETRSVGMLVFDDEGARGSAVAGRLQDRLVELDLYTSESRPWLPHVSVLRFRERPHLRPALPELGPVSPSDAAVFISRLRPGGAQYEVVEAVPLGG
jgi:RNA 2',3'-cyclic 3'-phosphodiesterase